MDDDGQRPFWKRKTLAQMSEAEWESLCDGCGRCCLIKLEEEIEGAPDLPGPIHFTNVGCRLLNSTTCRCNDYPNRQSIVPDCLRLSPETVGTLRWLPPTCGYKLVAEGQDLKWWHPLVSGRPETVHEAGVSVRGKVRALETDVEEEDLIDYTVSWPGKWPRGAKSGTAPHLKKKL